MKKLDTAITQHYHTWFKDAPYEYTDDAFFTSRVPVAITSRFGQNQQLAETTPHRKQERSNWLHERDYSKIRYLTFAIATHVRSVVAKPTFP